MIRVLVVDDHTIVRKGIKALLAETDDIRVVGEASNGLEAIQRCGELEPDVILMDLLMPEMDGIEATRQITSQYHKAHVLVLTSFVGDEKIFPAIKAGALGYLLAVIPLAALVLAFPALGIAGIWGALTVWMILRAAVNHWRAWTVLAPAPP